MSQTINISVIEHFKGICDPRRAPLHQLSEALTITLCATIAGANHIVGIVKWAEQHIAWLQDILELPCGLPSHDTLGRILSILDPNEFEQCFINWTNAVFKKTSGDIIPIDGKLLRGSYNTKSNIHAINVVGAFSTANGVLLGQVKTETKSNEIIAIPQLLKMLDIHGCIITIDAMGCQTEIASKIIEGGGDYVLAVKGNQPTLHIEVQEAFESALENNRQEVDFYETNEKDHGREDTRRYYVINDIEDLEKTDDFAGCSAIGMVESIRTINGERSMEKRYFILSFITIASFFAKCVRDHWQIENKLHWGLDVAFREDESRIRKDNAPANMGTIRRVGLNMIKQEKTEKVGVEIKRSIAGWNTKYLEKILGLC